MLKKTSLSILAILVVACSLGVTQANAQFQNPFKPAPLRSYSRNTTFTNRTSRPVDFALYQNGNIRGWQKLAPGATISVRTSGEIGVCTIANVRPGNQFLDPMFTFMTPVSITWIHPHKGFQLGQKRDSSGKFYYEVTRIGNQTGRWKLGERALKDYGFREASFYMMKAGANVTFD